MRLDSEDSDSLYHAVSQQLQRAVAGVRYGSVEIIIHDGRIVQIERREKFRLDADPNTRVRASPS